MQTYIAILRGINVSGQKIIKMAELREHLAILGFSNLTTYIQSGNIVFKTEVTSNQILEAKIHQNIQAIYGFDVPVIVRSITEWQKVVSDLPFNEDGIDIKKLGVVFLKDKPEHAPTLEIEKFQHKDDEVVYNSMEVYIHIPNGFGSSKLTNNIFERKLGVSATTRNWRTTIKLFEMASKC